MVLYKSDNDYDDDYYYLESHMLEFESSLVN